MQQNTTKLSVKFINTRAVLWLSASDTRHSRQVGIFCKSFEQQILYTKIPVCENDFPTCFPAIFGDMTLYASISQHHGINIEKTYVFLEEKKL